MPLTRAEPAVLASSFHKRVWGGPRLSPWFPDSAEAIGEVWFQSQPALPLLVKFIFTTAPLSVQVHPGDEYARLHEQSSGKTEMWHILRAEAGAKIAIGLREKVTASQLRGAALSGEIEALLNWATVRAGDTFHIPAGTIHAIGAGITLCEIQQNSDVTYRLYDYNRGRELHLDRALEVSILDPWAPVTPPSGFLARCRHFATQSLDLHAPLTYVPDNDRFHLLVIVEGDGAIGTKPFRAGEVWHIPPGAGAFRIEPQGNARLLRAYVP